MSEIFELKDGRAVEIREAIPSDCEGVNILLDKIAEETIFTYQYIGRSHTSPEKFEKGLSAVYTMVAVDGGRIVGILSIPHNSKHPFYNRICSFTVAILKEYSGNGLGHKFMNIIEAWAMDHNIHRIEAGVMAKNLPAVALYLKHGFEIEGIKRDCAYLYDGWYNEYMIGKILQ